MRKSAVDRGNPKAFVHPWMKHAKEFNRWVMLVRRNREGNKAEIDRLIGVFYPTVLESAKRIVRRPEFKHLQLDEADLVSEWFVELMEKNFCGYNARTPFYCYGLFLLWRKSANIARYEAPRRCKPIPSDASCDDDPSKPVEVAEEFDLLYPLFCALLDEVQEVFIRKYCFNESSSSIARDFGTTAPAIDRLTWKYRVILRKGISSRRRDAA